MRRARLRSQGLPLLRRRDARSAPGHLMPIRCANRTFSPHFPLSEQQGGGILAPSPHPGALRSCGCFRKPGARSALAAPRVLLRSLLQPESAGKGTVSAWEADRVFFFPHQNGPSSLLIKCPVPAVLVRGRKPRWGRVPVASPALGAGTWPLERRWVPTSPRPGKATSPLFPRSASTPSKNRDRTGSLYTPSSAAGFHRITEW